MNRSIEIVLEDNVSEDKAMEIGKQVRDAVENTDGIRNIFLKTYEDVDNDAAV